VYQSLDLNASILLSVKKLSASSCHLALSMTSANTFAHILYPLLLTLHRPGMAISQTRSKVQLRFNPKCLAPDQLGLRSCKNPDSTKSDQSGVEICRSKSVWIFEFDRRNVDLWAGSTDVPKIREATREKQCAGSN
jgi:hypothetical protein